MKANCIHTTHNKNCNNWLRLVRYKPKITTSITKFVHLQRKLHIEGYIWVYKGHREGVPRDTEGASMIQWGHGMVHVG